MKLTRSRLKEIIKEVLDELDEAVKRKVVRKGKLIKKTFCKPGQKAVKGRCVTMRGKEKAKRRMTQRRAAQKRKGKAARIKRKRAKAMRKRKAVGLK